VTARLRPGTRNEPERREPVIQRSSWLLSALGASVALLACQQGEPAATGITPQQMADALHAVMESDRVVYTKQVVNRLQNEENVIKASEHWKDDKALPLPAQMFRMGAEMVAEKDLGFSYALLSLWPVNKQNAPRTDLEKQGLQFVIDNPGKNFYGEEDLGERRFFTAVYADVAVAPACVTCHNAHKDSPRADFEIGDVMGGVVVRLPVGG
jgi:hypothetical protein